MDFFILLFIIFLSNKIRSLILPRVSSLSKVVKNTVQLSESIIEKFQGLRLISSNGLNDFAINEMNIRTNLLEKSLKKISYKILFSFTCIINPYYFSNIYCNFLFFLSERNTLFSIMCIIFVSLQRINSRLIGIVTSLSLLAESALS